MAKKVREIVHPVHDRIASQSKMDNAFISSGTLKLLSPQLRRRKAYFACFFFSAAGIKRGVECGVRHLIETNSAT